VSAASKHCARQHAVRAAATGRSSFASRNERAGRASELQGKFRDECLNQNWFLDLADARRKLEQWRRDYNQQRPHSALADRTPEELASVAMQLSKDLTLEAVCVERFK
jgi:transposase InsO family protein